MQALYAVLLALITSSGTLAQTYTINTFAGGGLPVNISGVSASVGPISSVAVDTAGNVFIASPAENVVLRLDAQTGLLTLAAGNGTAGFSGDGGPPTEAQLNSPAGVAVDSAGNLYIADTDNNLIRKVSSGAITTVAGGGAVLGDNGPATQALLVYPGGVAVDSVGNLYIAEPGANRIREVSNGVITTFAGVGSSGFSGDNGPAASAQLSNPLSVAVDLAGNLYIADTNNGRIRKVSNGVITTVVLLSLPSLPYGVAVDSAGNNLYIADVGSSLIRKYSNGVLTTVAGGGTSLGDGGPAASAQIKSAQALALNSAGTTLYIADTGNYRIRKVLNAIITTIAGNGTPGFSGDGGSASMAQLLEPYGVAADSDGNLYFADHGNNRIREVSNGVITTVAGDGTPGFSGDSGSATDAQLSSVQGVAVNSAGDLYIADNGNSRVRKVSNGVITTVAGNGTQGFSGDNGPATAAELDGPLGLAVDSAGNLYIADTGNSRVRKVANGVITTVAGNGTRGFSGDNGPATGAELNGPFGLAVDSADNLYIADNGNNRIREVSGGVINTVAGGGTSSDGPATVAQLNQPQGVAVDTAGNLYVVEYGRGLIREVSNGVITTIAGGGTSFGDGGPATSAQLPFPEVSLVPTAGIALDSTGNVYIADPGDNRVRILTVSQAAGSYSCNYLLSPDSENIPAAGGDFTITVITPGLCVWAAAGLPSWITVSGSPFGFGFGNLSLVVAPNAGSARSGSFSVGDVLVTITESGTIATCTYSLNPTTQTLPAAGGVLSVIVTAPGGCDWSASSLPSWITIPGNSSGSGNGTLILNITANTGAARTSTFPVGGVSLTISQADGTVSVSPPPVSPPPVSPPPVSPVACSLTLGSTSETLPEGGGTVAVTITAPSGCMWSATSSPSWPSWITISGNASGSGSGTLTLTIAPDSGAARTSSIQIGSASLTITQAGGAPAISNNGVVPLFSSSPIIQAGSWFSIYGTGFANGTSTWDGSFPISLGGVSVTVNSKPAYIWYVSPTQINAQAPDDNSTGTVSVVVTTAAGSATSTVALAQFSPSFSLFDGTYAAGVILTPNGGGAYGNGTYDLVGPSGHFAYSSRPVRAGEILSLYGVGFGPTNPVVQAGKAYSGAAETTNTVTVTIGGVPAKVLFSGISQAGEYQINVVVPNAGSGDQILQAAVGGMQTQANVMVTIQ